MLTERPACRYLQALHAIQTLNGSELGGRRILVREDREDRDVKQADGAAAEAPRAPRPARGAGRGAANGGRGGRGGRGGENAGESSGLQVGAALRRGFSRLFCEPLHTCTPHWYHARLDAMVARACGALGVLVLLWPPVRADLPHN